MVFGKMSPFIPLCTLVGRLAKHQYKCLEESEATYQALAISFLTPFIAKSWILGFLIKTSPFIPLYRGKNLGRHLQTCSDMSRDAQDLILGHFEKGTFRVREIALLNAKYYTVRGPKWNPALFYLRDTSISEIKVCINVVLTGKNSSIILVIVWVFFIDISKQGSNKGKPSKFIQSVQPYQVQIILLLNNIIILSI